MGVYSACLCWIVRYGHGWAGGKGTCGRERATRTQSRTRLTPHRSRALQLSTTNLDQIKEWIDNGRLDPTKPITPKELIEAGVIGSVKDGIKLLGRGAPEFNHPVTITVSRASTAAIEAIERAGGKITTRYYTRLSIKRLLEGKSVHTDEPLPIGAEHVERVLEQARKDGFKYRLPDPTSRWDIEYYRDPAHRGYMSHLLEEGKSPSLFFGVPAEKRVMKKVQRQRKVEEEKIF